MSYYPDSEPLKHAVIGRRDFAGRINLGDLAYALECGYQVIVCMPNSDQFTYTVVLHWPPGRG